MKKFFLPFFFIFYTLIAGRLAAQTGVTINTDGSAADGSAMLDVKATDKGILIPRITLTSSVTAPVNGLLVYQTAGTPGFYYYNGTAWVYIQNSSNANVTLQGNTFNGASQLVQLNASSQLPALNAVNLTGLNATNLASGTVAIARLGASGTAGATTFLRGDNSWSTPASGGTGQTFALNLAPPGSTAQHWTGLNGGAYATFGPFYRTIAMPVAGTFDALYVVGTISSSPATNNITVTLYKNGVATLLSVTITVSATGTTVIGSNLVQPISVVAGDLISLGMIQSNSAPIVQLGISTHFQ